MRTIAIATLLACTLILSFHLEVPASGAVPRVSGLPASELPPLGVSPKHPRLDSQLLAVASTATKSGMTAALRVARDSNLFTAGEFVRVVLTASGDRSLTRSAVGALGGQVEAEYADGVQALVPLTAIETIADSPAVKYVAQPFTPVSEAVTDEGVVASNASAWQVAGVTGAGVKVGIIDLGFAGYATAQASGDLPGSLATQDYCGGTMGSPETHGTAVAEIAHKMAPDAQLYLICIATSVNLGQAKDYAIAQGITIINHSVGWFNTSRGDGTGAAATPDAIVADARARGILWVNSAGNHGQNHWSGSFVDANANSWNDFAPGDETDDIGINAGAGLCVTLKWDSWPTTTQDFDLYLFKLSDLITPVAKSDNAQSGSQPPTESLCYTNMTGLGQVFAIAIRKFAATASPRFDLFATMGAPQYVVAAGSVVEPASSPSAMAAGAICFSTNALEPYSSQGPTIDGRSKPDISGQDATSSSVPDFGPARGCAAGFRGTSAASPHVAGAAALVAQANPTFTPGQIQSFLEGRAVDLGSAGKDNQFGSGRLWLGNSPVLTCATTSFTASPASPQNAGTAVTFTATATGCATPQFKYWILPPGGSWTIARDWGAAGFTWSTSGLAAGTYRITVYTRATGSAADFEAYSAGAFDLTP